MDEWRQRLRGYRPEGLDEQVSYPEAAVLVPITRSDRPELILTLRASSLSTHGGEVALPGGRRDPEDADLIATALREAEEEIGLRPDAVEVLGPLSPLVSRYGLAVTPYVALIPERLDFQPNADEIAAVFTVPLAFFCEVPPDCTQRVDQHGRRWSVPSYRYGDYRIWGLTAVIIVELVNLLYDAGIVLAEPPLAAPSTPR